jgi:hypothetical protein
MIICDISCPIFFKCEHIRETYPCYYEQGIEIDTGIDDDEDEKFIDMMTL